MILLVDVGNTRIKWQLRDGQKIVARGQLLHREVARHALGERLWGGLPRPRRVLIANVAGVEMAAALAAWITASWSLEPHFVETAAAGFGVRNAYAQPDRMGVDRWVGMIGARTLTARPCCIIDCGTAVTIDGLAADGRHLGGVILPGARLMRQALYANTHRIPPEAGQVTPFGRDTADCVWGGTAYAVAAAIDRISGLMQRQLGADMTRLLTGGDAGAIRPLLEAEYRLEPDLLFHGLLAMAGGENAAGAA